MFEKLYDHVCKKASVIIEEEKPVSFSGNWKFCDVCLTCIYTYSKIIPYSQKNFEGFNFLGF